MTNPEVLDELYGKGRSVFLAMQHSGNWEWYCNFMNRMVPHRTVDIYKKLTNPSFNALVYQLRTNRSDDDEMMVEDRAAKAFFEHLDQQRRAILFVADQSPRGVETDYWTEFLHQDTCWYPGLEYLARRCDFAVVFIDMKRTGRGRYNITYLPICEDPNTMEQGAIMEQYVRHVERFILEQPDNWLWSHRRWKHSREGMAS